jgi:ferredoxin-type protein NapH
MKYLSKYRFLLLRRFIQIAILTLFVLGNYAGLKILQGNYSSSLLFDKAPLSDPFAFLQLLVAGGLIGANVVIGAVIIALFYALAGGRVFCSYVCPMNMVTDLAAFIRRITGVGKLKQNLFLSRRVRYYMIALALALSFLFGIAAFEAISPIGMLYRGAIFGFGLGAAIVFVIFIFDIFVIQNGFCGYICPLGAFYALLGRFSFLKIKYDAQKCVSCMNCKTICPEKQILEPIGKNKDSFILDIECTKCGRCIEVCNDNALTFSVTRFKGKDKKYENSID